MRILTKLFKPLLARTLFREGTVRTIFWGPCRGLRYRIFPGYGLSPLYGGWEHHAQRLMKKHIRLGSIAYDLGANYGIHTLLMARLVGPRGRVYAFEPVPSIRSQLQENVALNGFLNVTFLEFAAADRTGMEVFFKGSHEGAGHLVTAGDSVGERLTVETITLDGFVFLRNNPPPDFIKIDVEGAEGKVLSGAQKVLQTFWPILLVDLHNPEQDVAVGRVLLDLQYEAYRTEDGNKVRDLTRGWPDSSGLWGEFIAFPRNKRP